MRSRFLVCAALAGFAFATLVSGCARGRSESKNAKKKGDELSEDKSGIGKTLQWEDKVMGPDDKGAELDKIRQAQAINKAAAEKAERDKAANAAREAKEKEAAREGRTDDAASAAVTSRCRRCPTRARAKGKSSQQHTEVSPKLETAAAADAAAGAQAGRRQVHRQAAEGRVGRQEEEGLGRRRQGADRHARVGEAEQGRAGKKGRKDGVDDLLTRRREGRADAGDEGQARDARVGEAGDSRRRPRRRRSRSARSPSATTASFASCRAPRQWDARLPSRSALLLRRRRHARTPLRRARLPGSGKPRRPGDGTIHSPRGPKKTVAARETHRDDSAQTISTARSR